MITNRDLAAFGAGAALIAAIWASRAWGVPATLNECQSALTESLSSVDWGRNERRRIESERDACLATCKDCRS